MYQTYCRQSTVTTLYQRFLTKLANDRGGACEIIDVKAKLETVKALGAGSYVSFSAYARLFIPALLADQYSRTIYIDCDTFITSSLTELSMLDLHGKPFAIGYDCIYNRYGHTLGRLWFKESKNPLRKLY